MGDGGVQPKSDQQSKSEGKSQKVSQGDGEDGGGARPIYETKSDVTYNHKYERANHYCPLQLHLHKEEGLSLVKSKAR